MFFPKSILLGSTLLATSTFASQQVNADVGGTFFSTEVTSLVYENVGYSGSYNAITDMLEGTCSFTTAPHSFSGPLAPLNEEITWHLRGPIELAKFAVYYPTSSSNAKKQKKREASMQRRHAHRHPKHIHKRDVVIEYATKVVYVTSTIDGGEPIVQPTLVSSIPEPVSTALTTTKAKHHKSHKTSSTSLPADSTTSAASSTSTGDWTRTGFYDADAATVDDLVFMNNMGAKGVSGNWSPCFGNTLSYMSSDGTSACAAPETLAKGVVFKSDKEFSIWSSEKCDSSSGYAAPGTPCQKGFAGDNKVFVFRFQMPHDLSSINNQDMSAIWALNSKIPRTQQYATTGNKLWPSPGEFDAFEVLSQAAADYMHSSLHSLQGTTYVANGVTYGGGGSPHFFSRPVDAFLTGAIAFTDDGKITVSILDDSFDFSTSLDTDTIKSWGAGAQTFQVPS